MSEAARAGARVVHSQAAPVARLAKRQHRPIAQDVRRPIRRGLAGIPDNGDSAGTPSSVRRRPGRHRSWPSGSLPDRVVSANRRKKASCLGTVSVGPTGSPLLWAGSCRPSSRRSRAPGNRSPTATSTDWNVEPLRTTRPLSKERTMTSAQPVRSSISDSSTSPTSSDRHICKTPAPAAGEISVRRHSRSRSKTRAS